MGKQWKMMEVIILIGTFLIVSVPEGCHGMIGCFMCSSRNSSNTDCEDPFNATTASYVEKCKVPKKNRGGEFPAHFCIKLVGYSYETGETVTIRRCVLENMDTQYGDFKLANEKFKGWILTCATDGCNLATTITLSSGAFAALLVLLFFEINRILRFRY